MTTSAASRCSPYNALWSAMTGVFAEVYLIDTSQKGSDYVKIGSTPAILVHLSGNSLRLLIHLFTCW